MELESSSLFLGGNHEDTVLRVAAVARPVGAYVLIRCLVLEVVELLPVQGDVGERAYTVELFDYPDDFLGYLAREACERGDNPVVLRLGFQFAEITAESSEYPSNTTSMPSNSSSRGTGAPMM